MPDLHAALPWIFVALLFVVALVAARSLRHEQTRASDAELFTHLTYRPTPARRPTRPERQPMTWDFFHDDYE